MLSKGFAQQRAITKFITVDKHLSISSFRLSVTGRGNFLEHSPPMNRLPRNCQRLTRMTGCTYKCLRGVAKKKPDYRQNDITSTCTGDLSAFALEVLPLNRTHLYNLSRHARKHSSNTSALRHFRTLVTLVWRSSTDSKWAPLTTFFTLGKSQQSQEARCSELGGWSITATCFLANNCLKLMAECEGTLLCCSTQFSAFPRSP